jgi:uncharacterized membrane protein YGL010W
VPEPLAMICPPLTPSPMVEYWFERHRNPVSFALHLVGIPPTLLGFLLIPIYIVQLSVPIFLFALALFVGGYLVQFLGHVLEGTDPGEIIYFKRKLGLRYVEFAPARRSRGRVA